MLGIRPTRAYKEEMRKKAQSAILRDKKSLNSKTEFRTIFYDEQAVQEGMGNQLDKIFFFLFSTPPPPAFMLIQWKFSQLDFLIFLCLTR